MNTMVWNISIQVLPIYNQYGMGGQTSGETMGFDVLARLGAGINPQQMHAEQVYGYNPLV